MKGEILETKNNEIRFSVADEAASVYLTYNEETDTLSLTSDNANFNVAGISGGGTGGSFGWSDLQHTASGKHIGKLGAPLATLYVEHMAGDVGTRASRHDVFCDTIHANNYEGLPDVEQTLLSTVSAIGTNGTNTINSFNLDLDTKFSSLKSDVQDNATAIADNATAIQTNADNIQALSNRDLSDYQGEIGSPEKFPSKIYGLAVHTNTLKGAIGSNLSIDIARGGNNSNLSIINSEVEDSLNLQILNDSQGLQVRPFNIDGKTSILGGSHPNIKWHEAYVKKGYFDEIHGTAVNDIRADILQNSNDIVALQNNPSTGGGEVGGTTLDDDNCQWITQPLIEDSDITYSVLDAGEPFTSQPSVVDSVVAPYEDAVYSCNKNNSTTGILRTSIESHETTKVFNDYQFCGIKRAGDVSLYALSSDTQNVKPVRIDSTGNITRPGTAIGVKTFSFEIRDNYIIGFGGGSNSTRGIFTWRLSDGAYQKIHSNGNECNFEYSYLNKEYGITIASPMYCETDGNASLAIVSAQNSVSLVKIATLSPDLNATRFCSWGKITQCPWNDAEVLIVNTQGGNKHFIFNIVTKQLVRIIDDNAVGINDTVIVANHILMLPGARVNSSLAESNKIVKITEEGQETLDVSIHPKFNVKKAEKMFGSIIMIGKKSSNATTGDVHILRLASMTVEEYDADKSTEFRAFARINSNYLMSLPYHDSTSQSDNLLLIHQNVVSSGKTADYLVRKTDAEGTIDGGEDIGNKELSSSVAAISVDGPNFAITGLNLLVDSNHNAALNRIEANEVEIEGLKNQTHVSEIHSLTPVISVSGDTINSFNINQDTTYAALDTLVNNNVSRLDGLDDDIEDLQEQIDNLPSGGGGGATFSSNVSAITIENNVITNLDLDQDSKFLAVKNRGSSANNAIDHFYAEKISAPNGNVVFDSAQTSFSPNGDFRQTIAFSANDATKIKFAPFANRSIRNKDMIIGTSTEPFDEGHFTKMFIGGTELDLDNLGGGSEATSTTSSITVVDGVITSLNLDQESVFTNLQTQVGNLESKENYELKNISTPSGFNTLTLEPNLATGEASVLVKSKNQLPNQTFKFELNSLSQSFAPGATGGSLSIGKADIPFLNIYGDNFIGTTLNGTPINDLNGLVSRMASAEADISSLDANLGQIIVDDGGTLQIANVHTSTITAHEYTTGKQRLRFQRAVQGDYIDILYGNDDNSIDIRPRNGGQVNVGTSTKWMKDGYFKINDALRTKMGTTDNYISIDKLQELIAGLMP